MLSYLFLGIIAAYLVGSVSALILNKKDHLCTYASFLSAGVASILGIVFSFSVLFGKNYEFTTSSDLPLAYGLFVSSPKCMVLTNPSKFYPILYAQETMNYPF